MTETPEPSSQPAAAPQPAKPNRLYQVAAWVVIVAGITFVVSAIFVTGVYVGQGGWPGRHHHGPCMMHHGPMGPGPDVGPEVVFPPPPGPRGPAGPGPAGPGNGPSGPGASPPASPPAPPRPPAPPAPPAHR